MACSDNQQPLFRILYQTDVDEEDQNQGQPDL
jgi:hypothetical protein